MRVSVGTCVYLYVCVSCISYIFVRVGVSEIFANFYLELASIKVIGAGEAVLPMPRAKVCTCVCL